MSAGGDLVYLQSLAYEFLKMQVPHLTIEEVNTALNAIGNVSIGRNLDKETEVLDQWSVADSFKKQYLASGKISTLDWKPLK